MVPPPPLRMMRSLWLAMYICLLGVITGPHPVVHAASPAQVVQYSFDKARAGGVVGSVNVVYDTPQSPTVSITADIDMRALNMTQVAALHPACEPHIQEYKWYLVVNDVGVVPLVGFLDMCDLLGQQDVVHLTTSVAAPSTDDSVVCNVSTTRTLNLSGQLGRLIVQDDGRISQSWANVPFPAFAQVTPRWSIVLHAVCGDASPPVVCARVDFELKATNSHSHPHVHRKEAHSIVGVAAFVLASSLLLFLS
ncbi:Aste57867_13968 [Aphanomyces stellatus]|uniref:Aste57867_13968 protein n=1 Tax=Aphanomyces stellatus TaxID=120398 RepID=A0A485L152_9STRA|nr:hypothetical protein As57867_013917 [Aphanomyces stellatus]VFT90798.1 Aste57867_13968 [Aphanomyces stellatus]